MAEWSNTGRRVGPNSGRNRLQLGMNSGDLQEEEVWSNVNREEGEFFRTTSTPRMIPRRNTTSSHYHCSQANEVRTPQRSSAPVNIPDWSKIYGKGKVMSSQDGTDDSGDGESGGAGEDDDEEEDEGMVPPHEWIARKLARTQISSSSMCEGLGRTLKGRDLSKVRNAILSKTGFLE